MRASRDPSAPAAGAARVLLRRLLAEEPRDEGVGRRALADAARAAEQESVVDPAGGDGPAEHPDRAALAEDVREPHHADLLARETRLGELHDLGVDDVGVAILDDADSMTIPAQNALLKTLEEPPGSGLLVLVAENPAALTATVRSRCQRVSFHPLPAEAIVAALASREPPVSGEDARFVADHAAGSVGRAFTLDPAKLRESLAAIRRLLDRVGAEGYLAVPSSAREILEIEERGGAESGGALALLAGELRGRLRTRARELTPQSKTASLAGDLRALEAVTRAIDDLRHNANKSLAVERMLVRVADLS